MNRLTWGHNYEHRYIYARHHRYVFKEGDIVMHLCDNPGCIEITHLQLGSNSENIKMSFDRGRSSNKGYNNPSARLTESEVKYILTSNESLRDLAEAFEVSISTISKIRTGKNWSSI